MLARACFRQLHWGVSCDGSHVVVTEWTESSIR
jgi:hypothetical protein